MDGQLAIFNALTGIVGGAISTALFHTPSLHKTAMKIVALGALQGAVIQIPSWQITAYFCDTINQTRTVVIQLTSAAVISAIAMAVMGTTRNEAVANFAISSAVSWIALH